MSQRSASPLSAPTEARDSLVRFALRQVGVPYVWAGTSPRTGFDCSGFITYVFSQFGVATPHATALLIDAGRPVPRAQAQPGDIVVFTGTAEGSTTPGHAGIVISALGETPLRFVHASSARRESGVKVSQVENSGYERRFMQIRRVLGSGPATASPVLAATSRPAVPRPLARPAGAVAALPAAAPAVAADLAVALPTRLALVPVRRRPRASASAKALKVRTKLPAATKRMTLAKRTTATKAAVATKASKKAVVGKATLKQAAAKKPAATGKKTTRPAAQPKPTTHRAKPKSH
ncbi:MAG: C40 family peptidase [Janthinobacterium lividum]